MKIAMRCVAILSLPVPMASLAAATGTACSARSNASVSALVDGNYKTAAKYFSPAIATQLPPEKIEKTWRSVQTVAGKYQGHGTAQTVPINGQPVVLIPVTFAHAQWDFIYACDDHDQIKTVRLAPATQVGAALEVGRGADEAKASVKTTTEANGVRVKPLPVRSQYGPLRGALTLPVGEGPFPAAVLVSGSGPNNLDEAIGGSNPFRDIADGLAAAGIASLRYDKRQTAYPLKMSANANLTVDDEETDDALTAAHLLTRTPKIDPHRVFVLGHSEGGMLAPRIGKRDPALAGLILLAAPARRLLTVIRDQTRNQGQRVGLPKKQIQASEAALAAEQKLLNEADPERPPQGSFGGAPQTWWLSLRDYDQVAVAESLSIPMLISQGGSDFQVSPENDFNKWKEALRGRANVTFHLYPGLSHLFTPAGKTGTTADYKVRAHVAPQVITDIANWINAQPPAK